MCGYKHCSYWLVFNNYQLSQATSKNECEIKFGVTRIIKLECAVGFNFKQSVEFSIDKLPVRLLFTSLCTPQPCNTEKKTHCTLFHLSNLNIAELCLNE